MLEDFKKENDMPKIAPFAISENKIIVYKMNFGKETELCFNVTELLQILY